MSSNKKSKLSLSKKKKQNEGPDSTPTILSMFKKQREKQSTSREVDETESDVVITKVVKSKSSVILGNAAFSDESKVVKNKEALKSINSRLKLSRTNSCKEKIHELKKNEADKGTKTSKPIVIEAEESCVKPKKTESHTRLRKSRDRKGKDLNTCDVDTSSHSDTCTLDDVNDSTGTASSVTDINCDTRDKSVRNSPRFRSKSYSTGEDSLVMESESDFMLQTRKRKLSLKKSKTDSELSKKKKLSSETDENSTEEVCIPPKNESDNKTKGKPTTKQKKEQNDVTSMEQVELIIDDIENIATNGDEDISLKYVSKATAVSKTTKKEVKMSKTDISSKNKAEKFSNSDNVTSVDDDNNENKEETEGDVLDEEVVYKVPYYLENFHTIIDTVLGDQEYLRLFNETDMGYITAFRELSEPCQKLYVRIFGRKLSWLPMVKLKYPEISDDIPTLVDELIDAGFLKSGEDLKDLPLLLKLLPAPDLKLLAKSYHINTNSASKPKLTELLLKKSQQNSIGSMFSGGKSASTANMMIKRAKSYLGKVCHLHEDVRAVFIRLLMLFCLYNTNFDEENGNVGQNQLFQMLMVNIGKVTYPSYTVNKEKPIFKDRDALVRFETALQFEMDVLHLVDRGKWNDAFEVYRQARDVGESILKNKQYRKWDSNLPDFLRFYTAGSIYVRIANQGVEILQRQKKYPEAVSLLEEMLAQELYCGQYRGHWYERLALNLDAHLKNPAKPLCSLNKVKNITGSIHARIANQGVEILQRQKKYSEAVSLLEEMLVQGLYCGQYRGHWYERLALNLDAHLKNPAKSLDKVKNMAGSIYLRIANQDVEILQRQKKYPEAVSLLEEMLAQELYCGQYRGHWYERLALNLDAHLKNPTKEILQRQKKYQEAVTLLEEMLVQGLYCGQYRGHWYERLALNLDAHLKNPAKPLMSLDKVKNTAGSIYVRIANQDVEILQRQKKYPEAVSLLEEMLVQELYCGQYRGHWYERLALNLDAHLKNPAKVFSAFKQVTRLKTAKNSLEVIKKGLSDDQVRSGRKLAIYERAKKICEAPKSKFSDRMKEFIHDPVSPTPETTIEGMVISDATSMGMKYQFIMQGDSDSVTLCAVEELVLEYYKDHGYPEGLHAEGSIIANLFTIYFWDILYMDVADVFQGPFQSCPLDLYTRDFYQQRREACDSRLDWIRNAQEQELLDEIQKIWDEHSGKMCNGMNWERFTGPETHQGLVSCMTGELIAGILERYVKDPRHTRSGFPDLTLWNTQTKALKISEVKGPNDRLSYKQILWIDYLLKLGIDAEVCYVKAVGSKKLKPKSSEERVK